MFDFKREIEVKVGDEVATILPGSDTAILGIMSDIDEGYGRFHIKVRILQFH